MYKGRNKHNIPSPKDDLEECGFENSGKPGFPQHLSTVTVNPAAADITCVHIEGLYQSYLWGRKRDFVFVIQIQKTKKKIIPGSNFKQLVFLTMQAPPCRLS